MISEGENFTLGQEAWLQELRIYGEKFYYSEKGIEKASDIDITRGQRVAHPLGGSGFIYIFSSVQSLSHVRLLVTTWTAACQASLSITNSRSLLRLMSIESVMPSNHLILCHPLLLLPSVVLSIRVFSNESAFHIRWPKFWSFSFSISPSYGYSGLISLGWASWTSLQSKGLSRVLSNTTVQKHKFFGVQLSL